jgi:hypothetical protein
MTAPFPCVCDVDDDCRLSERIFVSIRPFTREASGASLCGGFGFLGGVVVVVVVIVVVVVVVTVVETEHPFAELFPHFFLFFGRGPIEDGGDCVVVVRLSSVLSNRSMVLSSFPRSTTPSQGDIAHGTLAAIIGQKCVVVACFFTIKRRSRRPIIARITTDIFFI